MYQYEYESMKVTIILGHITDVSYFEGADTFTIYLDDDGAPTNVPAKFYDDFMDKLVAYIK